MINPLLPVVKNPILPGFYPDPSICRVGDDFYLVNSSFAYFPGLPVFHSKDLVNWTQIANAINRENQLDFTNNSITRGLFAPTIRYHKGTFYIVCTMIDNGGNFVITTKDPSKDWSDPIWLPQAEGIDPSLFFDDDKVWYVGNRCVPPDRSQYDGNCEIWLQELDFSDIKHGKITMKGSPLAIWQGALKFSVWPEGPHIYKIGNWYYLMIAEGGTAMEHSVMIARSKTITEGWVGKKANPILTHRHLGKTADIINVGHADMFDDPDGNWYLVCLGSRTCLNPLTEKAPHRRTCPLGRETFFAPVTWEDEWPVVSRETGILAKQYSILYIPQKINNKQNHTIRDLPARQTFENQKLPLHWLTIRNQKLISFDKSDGTLVLSCKGAPLSSTEDVSFAGRRLMDHSWTLSASIQFSPKTKTEKAGIVLFQNEDYHYRYEITSNGKERILQIVTIIGGKESVCFNEKIDEKDFPAEVFIILTIQSVSQVLSFYITKTDNLGNRNALLAEPVKTNIDSSCLSTEYSGSFVGTVAGVFATGSNSDSVARVKFFDYVSNEKQFFNAFPLIVRPLTSGEHLARHATLTDKRNRLILRGKDAAKTVFLGDSLTRRWEDNLYIWNKYFSKFSPENFGIGGETSDQLLWRIQEGELDGLLPKTLVLLTGTNNLPFCSNGQIIGIIKDIVILLRQKLPKTKIVLQALYPRSPDNEEKNYLPRIKIINDAIKAFPKKYAPDLVLDFTELLADDKGLLNSSYTDDGLHLNANGYNVIAPKIAEVLVF